jgi:hypothetical protein
VPTSPKRPVDGLDRSSLMDRYARTRAGTSDTPYKKASVQSVHSSQRMLVGTATEPIETTWARWQ